ncbi:unnamed protein product [Cuscuta campestris]|uniref:Integrase catalytic domain-containing protein n=1 Tax=Cuscuta campestris TaxID=132261 RepID=A0A484MSV7_9ASTE|nr:unnamed protein product [Cuscuta campestris]
MVQTRSNANVGTGVPQQGENSATGGRHPPITTGEAEALIQRVGITAEQFKEVLAALAPNREVVVGNVARGPTGEKAGPAGSQGKKKKVRRSQKKKATKPNGKAMMADALSRLEEEDESSSFERMSAFDRLGDPKSKKPRTSAFERLQDTRNRTWRRPPAPTAAITAGEGQEDGRRHLGRDCDDLDEEERQGRRHLGCRFIMGGNTGGDSVSSRKKWKNMVYLAEVQRPPLPKRKKKEPLIFTDEDYPPVLSPHRDALVIRVEINNVVVHRTLVDTGSSVNVMYSNTFKELGLSRSDLKPIHTPLSGFTGDTIEAEGTITVKAGVGDGTHRLWVDMEFMVVQLDCAHHLILGRPGLEDLECIISPVHLCLKFNTPTGVGVAKGNQSLSRSCYVRATKSQARVDENVSTICAAIQKEEGRPRAEPAEEVEEVSLDPVEPERKVKVGKTLPLELKEQLLEVLRAFKVLFAWGPEDMPGVDPKVICHRLEVDPTHKTVKQKKRFLSSERREFVTKQVTTLQSIGHIREVLYPECYAAVGYPQTNGQVENTNRTIMDGLKKKIMECKSALVEEVPHILWTYRTTPRKATGETPFSLTYGFEARAPAETSLLSYRVETFDAQGNEENLRAELHLIDERRERAYMRAENYRRQVKSYHDHRVRPRQFKMGDWVLRKREVSRPTDGGRFAKSFEGPYIIKEVLADGTFRLQTPTDGDVPRGMEGAWSIPVNPPVRQAVGGEGLVRLTKVFIRVWRWWRRFHRRPLPARQPATEFVRVKPPQSLELTDLGEGAGSGEEGAGPSERSKETGIPSDMARMEKRRVFGDGAE